MAIRFGRQLRDRLDRKALQSIARTGPDQPLPTDAERAVPRLRDRGWLRIVPHSDGDYVVLTDRGRAQRGKDGNMV